jgi:hypothetical protein
MRQKKDGEIGRSERCGSNEVQNSALHADPSEHTFYRRIFVKPVSGSSIGAMQIAHDVFVGDVREFLQ